MQIKDYPPSKLDRLLLAARELADSGEVEAVKVNQDRPIKLVNGNALKVGPAHISINIECKYENK